MTRRPLERGQVVVDRVLAAAVEILAEQGYGALSFDAVARRAEVARTTIYRRWPTRAALARSAVESLPGAEDELPDRGSLREDLLELARRVARFGRARHGKAILKLFAVGGEEPELADALDALRRERDGLTRAILERARQRGELSHLEDAELLIELLPSALYARTLLGRTSIDERALRRLVDFLLRSLRAGAAPQHIGC